MKTAAFNLYPSAMYAATGYFTLLLNPFLFALCILGHVVHAQRYASPVHANRVSGVNEYFLHVGNPGVLNDTVKAWICHLKC